mgnify:CR=1 FL=1
MRGDPHPLFLYGGVFDEKPGDRNFTSNPADDLDSYDKEKTGGNAVGVAKNNPELLTGRTDSNKVVIFEGSKELIDTIIDLKIISEHMWYLKGQII